MNFYTVVSKELDRMPPTQGRIRQKELFDIESKLMQTCAKQFPFVYMLSNLPEGAEYNFGQTYLGTTDVHLDQIVVVKVFKSPNYVDRVVHCVHELIVGVVVVNALREYFPTFVRTEGFAILKNLIPAKYSEDTSSLQRIKQQKDNEEASKVVIDQKSKEVANVPVILLEPVLPSVSLKDWLLSGHLQPAELGNCFMHLICSLGVANREFEFIHQDFNLGNVLVQPVSK